MKGSIIQIAVDEFFLYALTDRGEIWVYDKIEMSWQQLR